MARATVTAPTHAEPEGNDMFFAKIHIVPGPLCERSHRETIMTAVQQACVEQFSTPDRPLDETSISVIPRLLLDTDRITSDVLVVLQLDGVTSYRTLGDVNAVHAQRTGERIASRLNILDPEAMRGVSVGVILVPTMGSCVVTVRRDS